MKIEVKTEVPGGSQCKDCWYLKWHEYVQCDLCSLYNVLIAHDHNGEKIKCLQCLNEGKAMKQYTWSFDKDADVWNNGTFDTKCECLLEAQKGLKITGINQNRIDRVYIGEVVPFVPQVDAEDILVYIQEQAVDFAGEVAHDWESCDCRKTEELRELDKSLTSVVNKWLKKYGYSPNFYSIQNIKEYKL